MIFLIPHSVTASNEALSSKLKKNFPLLGLCPAASCGVFPEAGGPINLPIGTGCRRRVVVEASMLCPE